MIMETKTYHLSYTNLLDQDVQLIGWNNQTPKHKGKAKAWFKYALPGYAKQLPVKTFESGYGHGFGFRVDVDNGYFTFEGKEIIN